MGRPRYSRAPYKDGSLRMTEREFTLTLRRSHGSRQYDTAQIIQRCDWEPTSKEDTSKEAASKDNASNEPASMGESSKDTLAKKPMSKKEASKEGVSTE
jgi:hypothetical protein